MNITDDLFIGGLSSGRNYNDANASQKPNIYFLSAFEKVDGFKILLCHHPEYYKKYLYDRNIDLIISGHAHGGQVRFLNQGLFAPGQGLFPKFTSGMHDGKLIVSRGIAGTELFPRINNSAEIVYIIV